MNLPLDVSPKILSTSHFLEAAKKKKKKKKRKKTLHLFVSLALLILRVRARREIMAPGVPSGDCGNWAGDKNRDVPQRHASFCEESLGRSDAKDDELFHEFYRLKALISLEQVNTNFSKNLDGGVLGDRVLKTFIVCKCISR